MNRPRSTAGFVRGLSLTVSMALSCLAAPLPQATALTRPAAAPGWALTGELNTARYSHTATLLQSGKVLVVGGSYCVYASCSNDRGVSSAELYDPTTSEWGYTGSLNTGRVYPTATLLPSGQVLVAGGYGSSFGSDLLSSAELYDPVSGQWRPTGGFNSIRGVHSATLLQNGKVLAVGDPYGNVYAELYDPSTGTWSAISAPTGRGHLVLLPTGKVIVLGVSAQLYDPATETWASTGNHGGYPWTATLLRNGKVLVTGYNGNSTRAELYDPTTGTWSVTGRPNSLPGELYSVTLLPDGRVLRAGGYSSYYAESSGDELYDPATGTWSYTSRLVAPRDYHTATLLPDGKVLVAGGVDGFYDVPVLRRSAELYTSDATANANPIDNPQFFARQQYLDFLTREPETGEPWTAILANCPNQFNQDPANLSAQCDRLTVSAAFFNSPEFRLKGFFVFNFYRAAFGRLPEYAEIVTDMAAVTGQTPTEVYARKAAYTNSFVQRAEFTGRYGSLSDAAYVSTLMGRYGLASITTPDPSAPDGTIKITLTAAELASRLTAGTLTRAQVLRAVADSDEVAAAEYNRAFVAMQYYGYLRRTPEVTGYEAWLRVISQDPGNVRLMVNGFVNSQEYRRRFGQP
jgi:hypothetical protein